MNIVGVNAPNDDTEDKQKEDFYDKLRLITNNISSRKEIVIIGDLNARTGSKRNDPAVGPHRELVANDNGSRLIEYCKQYGLRIMNGFFQHRNVHRYTWTQTTRQLASIIDYVIIKQHTHIKPQDVRVYRGAECGSDHFLVIVKLYLPCRKMRKEAGLENGQKITLDEPRYKVKSLQQDSVRFLYALRVANRISAIEDGTPERMYQGLKKALQEAAYEALGQEEESPRKTTPIWWNADIEDLVITKKAADNKWLTTRGVEDRKGNINVRRETNKRINIAKNETWQKTCSAINSFLGSTCSREAWKTLAGLRKDTREKRNMSLITMEEWENYYKTLLTEVRVEFLRWNKMSVRLSNKYQK